MNGRDRALEKAAGQLAAKGWLKTASIEDVMRLAGAETEYGDDTIDALREVNIHREELASPDFSWGFYKQVKSYVFHVIRQSRSNR